MTNDAGSDLGEHERDVTQARVTTHARAREGACWSCGAPPEPTDREEPGPGDLELDARVAIVRERFVVLQRRCPVHVPRDEFGRPCGDGPCACVPERGWRIGEIRRAMEDRVWLPDGGPYADAVAEVLRLAPATVRNDSSVARNYMMMSIQDPERQRQEQVASVNAAGDMRREAWAAGDRGNAARFLEMEMKANRAIAPAGQFSIHIDQRTGQLLPEIQNKVEDKVRPLMVTAARAAARLGHSPEEWRDALRAELEASTSPPKLP